MCTTCSIQIDTQKADAFADKLLQVINYGALGFMVSIGHRTGLYDTLHGMPPSTSEEIAEAAALNERYVREWLGAMTVARIVSCDPDGPRFSLPEEHALFLTRANPADNFAVFGQYLGVMGSVEDKIVECFRHGGGVAYSEFGRFHDVMAEESGQSVGSSLLDKILPLVPGLVENLREGIEVLDIGCGYGRAINLMARTFPNSRFTGYDLSEEAITQARAEAKEAELKNLRFEQKDLTYFNSNGHVANFDLITAFDAIHDQARPDNVLAGVARALRPDGTFLMQDIAGSSDVTQNVEHPLGPFLYTVSTMHCMTVSLAQEGGMGLGTMWGKEKALEMLREAGFGKTKVKTLDHDVQNYYYIVTK